MPGILQTPLIYIQLLWCQVLTVTSCHMVYILSPPSANATFADRIPTAARNVKVHLFRHMALSSSFWFAACYCPVLCSFRPR